MQVPAVHIRQSMKSNRDELLRRKKWAIAFEVLCICTAVAVPAFALQLSFLSVGTKFALMGLGLAGYLLCIFLMPPRWVRCPSCDYDLTRLSLRRKKTLQINVCPHCGLALDAPSGAQAGSP